VIDRDSPAARRDREVGVERETAAQRMRGRKRAIARAREDGCWSLSRHYAEGMAANAPSAVIARHSVRDCALLSEVDLGWFRICGPA
jgi:hypothetical protein